MKAIALATPLLLCLGITVQPDRIEGAIVLGKA